VDGLTASLLHNSSPNFAQHYWRDADPIGKRLRIGTAQMQTPWLTVVGEVSDTQLLSPDNPATEQYYVPVEQAEENIGSLGQPDDLNGNGGFIVLRSAVPPEQMENALRATVRSIDPLLPLTQVQTMEQVVSESESSRRFNTALISSFAFAAVLLAILGIYSVIAFSVASRGAGDGHPDDSRLAARCNYSPGACFRRKARIDRLRHRIGRGCRGLKPDALHALQRESV
jgi:hypothetical protein